MTVKEILLEAAALIGVEDKVKNYIEASKGDGEKETQVLLRCFNLVEDQLAIEYLPLKCEETLSTETGAIYFKQLKKPIVRVMKVEDSFGNEIAYKLFPDYIKTAAGTVCVSYCYSPIEKTIGEESDFNALVTKRTFAYGIAAEYCMACGLYEESAVWERKYKHSIEAAYRAQPSKTLASRRWV